MPRSKNWSTYPRAFHDLLESAAVKSVALPCADEAQARSLRAHIYGFFGALEHAIHQRDVEEEARRLRSMSTQVKLRLEGSTLYAFPADEHPLAQLITKSLGEQTDKPLESAEHQGPSAELLRILNKLPPDSMP